jgi:CHAT domain-containing protein
MSLWSVEDRATREWMEAFYRARLQRGAAPAAAAREASLQLLRDRRRRGESEHPFFWGAFVACGGD